MTATETPESLKELGLGMRASRDFPGALSAWLDPRYDPTEFSQRAIRAICGTKERVIIVLPPSHGKSRAVADALTWILGAKPQHKITLASWSDAHGIATARTVRDRIAQSPRLKLVFPRLRLSGSSRAVADIETDTGGGLSTIRVGEQVPMCDLLVIDDPLQSYTEAASAVNRAKVWDWYISAAFTRLNVGGRIVLICSRTHDEDLAGRLMAQGGWRVIHYKAINYDVALWPAKIPLDYLRKTQAAITEAPFKTAYQGEPDKSDGRGSTAMPRRESFKEFLEKDAMVPGDPSKRETRGTFQEFTFHGREALVEIVHTIDSILAGPIKDAQVAIAGGAQWGKTTIEHAFSAYCTGQLFRNVMTFLPTEDLVSDIVQTKFRTNCVDQMPWFAGMIELGKTTNESGKTVNRVGVYSVTDGIRKATGMFCGLNKVPTTHSADVALVDEVDDVNPQNEKFIAGRLTASDLRLIVKAGTQRVHGRGMNKAWKDGSQGVMELSCTQCGFAMNPEESFPSIVCLKDDDATEPARLTFAGDFRRGDEIICGHSSANSYFMGCTKCGAELDRHDIKWKHRRPEKIAHNEWSYRVSQLGIPAIELGKIVNEWEKAVNDDEKMLVFRTDVLAIPKSTAQRLTPEIIDRARRIEVFDAAPKPVNNLSVRYAGLDMGGRCWFVVREKVTDYHKRVVWAESIPLHQVSDRVPQLVDQLGVATTFIDQMPETKESRTLAMRLNGLDHQSRWGHIPTSGVCHVSFGNGLAFKRDDNGEEKWIGLKAAVVRFDHKKPGQGITQKADWFIGPDGREICVPMIVCNRTESVDLAVREFLTPTEGEVEAFPNIGIRQVPSILLPTSKLDIWKDFDDHHISGSERERDSNGSIGDYVDGIANHLLFANTYARLAEIIGGRSKTVPFSYGRATTQNRTSGL